MTFLDHERVDGRVTTADSVSLFLLDVIHEVVCEKIFFPTIHQEVELFYGALLFSYVRKKVGERIKLAQYYSQIGAVQDMNRVISVEMHEERSRIDI